MSKDMIGSVVRAAVTVPQERLDTLAKIASKMAVDNTDGDAWHWHLKQKLEAGLPENASTAHGIIVFEKNQYGHIVFEITGLALSGAEEIERLKDAGYRVGDSAKSCLMSSKPDGYDANHRLIAGQKYRIVLVLGKELARNRTTKNLQAHATKFGYEKPVAGIIPRIREAILADLMKEIGIWYIAGLHTPITDADGNPDVLGTSRYGVGQWVGAFWGGPVRGWNDEGAFAFLLPANFFISTPCLVRGVVLSH
jgi:hypothetical protein